MLTEKKLEKAFHLLKNQEGVPLSLAVYEEFITNRCPYCNAVGCGIWFKNWKWRCTCCNTPYNTKIITLKVIWKLLTS